MSSRYSGLISIERFLAVERHHESHQPPSTHPRPRHGLNGTGGRANTPKPRNGGQHHPISE